MINLIVPYHLSINQFRMQIAINAFLFALGFMVATAVAIRPRKSRSDIVTFLNRLRYVTNGLKSGSPPGKLEKVQLLAERTPRGLEDDASGLLTRYVRDSVAFDKLRIELTEQPGMKSSRSMTWTAGSDWLSRTSKPPFWPKVLV